MIVTPLCSSPQALVDYIQVLNRDDKKYEAYLEWKKGPFSEGFQKLQKIVKYESKCRLCMRIHGLPVSTWASS